MQAHVKKHTHNAFEQRVHEVEDGWTGVPRPTVVLSKKQAVCAQLCSALIVLVVHASLASHLLSSKNPAQHILCLGSPRLCNSKATQLPHTNWSKPR